MLKKTPLTSGKCLSITDAVMLHGVCSASREIGETSGVPQEGTFCLGALRVAGGERADNSKSSTMAADRRGAAGSIEQRIPGSPWPRK